MINLSRIEICGFRGIRDLLTIDFSRGFTIFTGPNGSGKSSVLDAIEFVLSGTISKYGDHAGEKGETISDYEWWRGPNPPSERFVRLELFDEFGARTTITRKPEGLEILGHESILNLLCDTAVNPESSIEELCRTSIIRDEFIAKNSVDLPETERFLFVRAAVGGHSPVQLQKKLTEADKLLKVRINDAERTYNAARDRVQSSVERLATAKGQASQEITASDAEATLRGLLDTPASDVTQLLSQADAEIKHLRIQADSINSLLSKAAIAAEKRVALEQDGSVAKRATLEREIAELTKEHGNVEKAVEEQGKTVATIQSTNSFIADLAQLHAAGKAIGLREEKCPLCGSSIDEKSFRGHLEEIAIEIANHGVRISQAIEEQRGLRDRESALRRHLEDLVASNDRLRAEINTAEKQWENFLAEALRFNSDYSEVSVDRLMRDWDRLKIRLSSVEQSRRGLVNSELTERVVDMERDLHTRREVATQAEKQIAKLRRVESQLEEAMRVIKRASAEAVEERLAAIKPLFTELYLRLRPHKDWKSISYAIRGDVRRFLSLRVDENLNVKFLFSSGQRRATGLAFLISVALSRPWCRLKTLILDDPVQHVDDFRAVHLVETLAAIRTMNYQLICSVEDDALADLLARRLRSSYEEGGTLVHMSYLSGEGAKVVETKAIAPFEQVMMSLAS